MLGLASAAAVGRARGFTDLGMDSLGAVELCKALERSLGVRLPKTAAFDYPTVQRLAAHLGDLLDRQAPAVPAGRPAAVAAAPEPIAVVGVGCRFPGGADGPDAYWRLLTDGVDAVRRAPEGRFDDARLWWGGFLDEAAGFDAPFFRIPPREAKVMDPQQRMFLEVAWEALEHAGIPPAGLDGSRTGVFVGMNSTDYAQRVAARSVDAFYGTGTSFSAAGRPPVVPARPARPEPRRGHGLLLVPRRDPPGRGQPARGGERPGRGHAASISSSTPPSTARAAPPGHWPPTAAARPSTPRPTATPAGRAAASSSSSRCPPPGATATGCWRSYWAPR